MQQEHLLSPGALSFGTNVVFDHLDRAFMGDDTSPFVDLRQIARSWDLLKPEMTLRCEALQFLLSDWKRKLAEPSADHCE